MGIFGKSKKELEAEIKAIGLRASAREAAMLKANTNAQLLVIKAEEETERYKRLYLEQLEENCRLAQRLREQGVTR